MNFGRLNFKKTIHNSLTWLMILATILSGCKRTPLSTGVVLLSENAPGVIVIEALGSGIGMPSIEQNAKQNAFDILLFQGLSSASVSAYRLPLVSNQNSIGNFTNDFFTNKKYEPFVSQITQVSKPRRLNSENKLSLRFRMTINYDALRRYLENQNIIRKFGY
ncbi:hypothetical protein P1X15_15825 [Runella sp. MFBS21]|uniref:hypothetical protein n=1 Tax=Runella sp. MFBS21 TaxID=3034018 RepID=UPI0023F9078D|nr:hypothetical protein [Runella sp. MFBS21]MDF7819087.1 hypothetical protein [Runella sp. MFBS21]